MMKQIHLPAVLAVLAIGCGDGAAPDYDPVTGTERPARFVGSGPDGEFFLTQPEGNPIRTPENYHPVDEVTDPEGGELGGGDGPDPGGPGGGDSGCHQTCDGDATCLTLCDATCGQSSACADCVCDNGFESNVCAVPCGLE